MRVSNCFEREFGAGNEIRTRDPNLGKVVLYQLSYSRLQALHRTFPTGTRILMECRRESNTCAALVAFPTRLTPASASLTILPETQRRRTSP